MKLRRLVSRVFDAFSVRAETNDDDSRNLQKAGWPPGDVYSSPRKSVEPSQFTFAPDGPGTYRPVHRAPPMGGAGTSVTTSQSSERKRSPEQEAAYQRVLEELRNKPKKPAEPQQLVLERDFVADMHDQRRRAIIKETEELEKETRDRELARRRSRDRGLER